MYTLHPLSPDNSHTEDFALTVKEGTHIPDDTTILVSKNTYVEGGLFRFVQMIHNDQFITFSISFDDGNGKESPWGDTSWKWSLQTDFHKHMQTMRGGSVRFSQELKDMVVNTNMVSGDNWDSWVLSMCGLGMIHEAIDYINEFIDANESIESIYMSHVTYADLLQSQAETSLEKAKSLLENSSRYEVKK